MHEFDTPDPVQLRVELQHGDVTIEATDRTTTTVELVPGQGEAAHTLVEQTAVEQRGDAIAVIAPRRNSPFFRRPPAMDVIVHLPTGSSIDVRVHAGDVQTRGTFDGARVRTSAGDVELDVTTGQVDVATGSGDIELDHGGGPTKLATGSGDVKARAVNDVTTVATGSGDVQVRRAAGRLDVSSGSGDVHIDEAHTDVTIKTGSGDQEVRQATGGRVSCQTASGDVKIGIADGTPAWLDVHSLTGSVHSSLGASEPPAEGERSVQVHANTVSGDITLSRA